MTVVAPPNRLSSSRSTDQRRRLKLQLSVQAAVHSAAEQHSKSYCSVEKGATIIRAPARSTGRLQDVAAEVSGVSLSQVQDLIQLGAVYYGDLDVPFDEKPRWRKARDLKEQALDHPIQQVSA